MTDPNGGHKQGYGNIYTPHAGSMIIQVQREGGLANRTIVLSPTRVRMMRFILSRTGMMIGCSAPTSIRSRRPRGTSGSSTSSR